MLAYLLKVTLCWAVFYLLYHLLLGKETFFRLNRWYLLGTMVAGLAIPAVELDLFVPVDVPAAYYYLQPITIGVEQLEAIIITASDERQPVDVWQLLVWIYWAGVAVSLIRFGYGLLQINMLYRAGERAARPGYRFVSTPAPHVPFSFFKNLFWSKHFEVGEEDRQSILRHEEAHIFQWHSLDVLLLELAGIFCWCSPLIYLYKKAVKTTHEYLADAYVTEGFSKKQYGRLLLRQSQSGMQIAISNSLFSSQLKKRIVMMTKTRSSQRASLKYLAAVPALALLFLVFSFTQKNGDGMFRPEATAALIDTLPDGQVFKVVEEMPRFPGCEEVADAAERDKCAKEMLFQFIGDNLKYPKTASKKGIQADILAQLVIEKDGSVTQKKVSLTTNCEGCEDCIDEVIKLVSMMPNWVAGKHHGEAVPVELNLPIKFRLDAEAPSPKMETERPEVYKVVEEMPVMEGCGHLAGDDRKNCSTEKLMKFIFGHLKYPKEAEEKGIEGMVVAKFIIEKDGTVSNPEIIRSIGGGCDEEVLRVVREMPKWTPGTQEGKPVAVEFTLPVKFKMDGKEGEKVDNKALKEVDQMPRFAGCEDAEVKDACSKENLVNFIVENLKYPEKAKKAGVEGTVVIKFVISESGAVRDAQAIKGIGAGCDEEALRVVNQMPDWTPGMKDGKAVSVEMSLPFKFALPPKAGLAKAEIFEVFPNPSSENGFNVRFKAPAGKLALRFYDAVNKGDVMEKSFPKYDGTEQTVRIGTSGLFSNGLSKGTAFVGLYDEKGNVLGSTTVVVQ
ncbi:MAG: M56 family metallopeptidase [Saprospiraceae bacterium]